MGHSPRPPRGAGQGVLAPTTVTSLPALEHAVCRGSRAARASGLVLRARGGACRCVKAGSLCYGCTAMHVHPLPRLPSGPTLIGTRQLWLWQTAHRWLAGHRVGVLSPVGGTGKHQLTPQQPGGNSSCPRAWPAQWPPSVPCWLLCGRVAVAWGSLTAPLRTGEAEGLPSRPVDA